MATLTEKFWQLPRMIRDHYSKDDCKDIYNIRIYELKAVVIYRGGGRDIWRWKKEGGWQLSDV